MEHCVTGKSSPALSVVSISYKDPLGLKRTYESIARLNLHQADWEWVVIDSSPEMNEDILKEATTELARNGVSVQRVIQRPEGIYSAMNDGIRAASGKVLWFLNGGDTCADVGAVSELVDRLLSDSNASWLIASVNREKDGALQYAWHVHGTERNAILGYNRICHQGVLYKSDVFQTIGGYRTDLRQASDYDHLIRIVVAQLKAIRSHKVIANFDVSGLGSQRYRDGFEEMAKVFASYRSSFTSVEYFRGLISFRVFFFFTVMIKEFGHIPVFQPLKPLWLRIKALL